MPRLPKFHSSAERRLQPCLAILYFKAGMRLDDYQPTTDLSRAGTIPGRWYTDPAMLALEREKIFARTWQAAGYTRDVAQPGDYFGCDILGEPVVVARANDGALRAFSNVCRHRAAVIATTLEGAVGFTAFVVFRLLQA